MKLGILGTGKIVQRGALEAISLLRLEYVSILGRKESEMKVRWLAEEFKLDAYHLDYDEMLATEIDTVYVALPNNLHYEFAKKALQNGKNVIIEKPITSNIRELENLIELAERGHLLLLEAMSIYHLPAFNELGEKIKELGQVKIINMNHSQISTRYAAFKEGNILPAFDYRKSGGALVDLNIYNLSVLVCLFGKPDKFQYYANIEKQIDTSGILTLSYPGMTAVAIAAKDSQSQSGTVIQGEKGTIYIKGRFNELRSFQCVYNDNKEETFTFELRKERLYYEFSEFVKIIETKDFKRAKIFRDLTYGVMEILTKAREQERIVFENDNKRN